MAPFGKLYGYEGNPRTRGLQVIAKENNLEVELVHTHPGEGVSDDYRKINKLGRIPTFEGADGYVLSEMLAIAVYLTSQNEKTTLLGKTKQDYASILRWLSFANSEILVPMGGWFRPLLGKDPYNKKNVEDAQKRSNSAFKVMEDHLMINTFLVGERISLADIIAAGIVSRGMELVLDKAWRSEHPSVTRWFETIVNQANYKSVAGEPKFAEEAIKYTPPAKEKPAKQESKKAEPKAAAKKKDVEEDDEEEEDKPAPKPKHPIEELPKSSIPIDDWKRKFKNEETREVALPWFWESMPLGEEFTIWKIDYKYPEELTKVFMTSNLVSGLFTRLEGSRKYIQGCASVFGEDNDSVIQGAFVIRGKDHKAAFDVAPDWESYDFTQLDPKNTDDKKFFEDMMSWDQPVTVKGKEYKFQDGKIFV